MSAQDIAEDIELSNALYNGDLIKVLYWVSSGANIKFRSQSHGLTALHYACVGGHMDTVLWGLEQVRRGLLQLDAVDGNMRTPLFTCIEKSNLTAAKAVYEAGGNLLHKTKEGFNAMCIAAGQNDPAMLDWVFQEGSKLGLTIEDESISGNSPIQVSILNLSLQGCIWFVGKGANLKHRQRTSGNTCLHSSAEAGSVAIMAYMIEECKKVGITIETPDLRGNTVFLDSVNHGKNVDLCKYLVEHHNADLKKANFENKNALHFACTSVFGGVDILQYVLDVAVPKHLSLDARDIGLRLTPMQYAGISNRTECVKLIAMKAGELRAFAKINEAFVCSACGDCDKGVKKLMCACKGARFCGKECQRGAYKNHKADCMKWRNAIARKKVEEKEAKEVEDVEVEEVEEVEDEEVEQEEKQECEKVDESNLCSGCGNSDAEVEKFACAACGETQYCGQKCQRTHWRAGHKTDCKEWCKGK